MGRWLRGTTEPRLPELLSLVQATTQRLLEFVDVFTPAAQLPQVREVYRTLERQRQLAYEYPSSHAVLRALELDSYKTLSEHDGSWLALRLGFSTHQVKEQLDALMNANLVEFVDRRFKPKRVMLVDTSPTFSLNRQLKQHWARVAAERAGRLAPHHRSLFSFNLFPISSADFERLRALHLEYYNRVRELVAKADRADHVVLLNVQLCALDER